MTSALSTADVADARERAAADLETAIADLGAAFKHYLALTALLDARLGADLGRRIEVPIILHLAQAGLGGFLERKLQGRPAALRTVVEEQHEREGLPVAREEGGPASAPSADGPSAAYLAAVRPTSARRSLLTPDSKRRP